MTDKLVGRWIVIALVLGLAGWALTSNDLNYGIDLEGGVSLSYKIDLSELGADLSTPQALEQALADTVQVISTRINTLGVKDISVRREGTDRIKIQAPKMSDAELAETKRTMTQLGDLSFPIGLSTDMQTQEMASRPFTLLYINAGQDLRYVFDQAVADAQREEAIAAAEALRDASGQIPSTITAPDGTESRPYRDGTRFQLKHPQTGVDLPVYWLPRAPRQPSSDVDGAENDRRRAYIKELASARDGLAYDKSVITGGWVYFDPEFYSGGQGISGRDIGEVREGRNQQGQRTVNYVVNRASQQEFFDYTSNYVDRPMCLALNDELWTNPTINQGLRDNVEISGGRMGFGGEEVRFIINCLQSGSLKLRPVLDSEETIGATLGQQAVSRGQLATMLGGVLIVIFMLFYYRFSGVIAVVSLGLNLVLLISLLAVFRSTLTLPGIAGIILTIGMSVDASILIFERIREEMEKNKTLAAAVKSGFDRAFVTIFDANLTTIITGIILYQQGVGPIRGFAVTLIAGIVCSLFTTLFFARTLFGMALKNSKRETLTMGRIVPAGTRIDFLSRARGAATLSIILVGGALALFFATGQSKYGLDFTGGTVVRINLGEERDAESVRATIAGLTSEDGTRLYSETEVTEVSADPVGDFTPKSSYEIKLQAASRVSEDDVRARITPDLQDLFGADFANLGSVENMTAGGSWNVAFNLTEAREIAEVRADVTSYAPTDERDGSTPYLNARVEALDGASGDGAQATGFLLVVTEQDLGVNDLIRESLSAAFGDILPKNGAEVDQGKAFSKVNYIGPSVVAKLKENAVTAVILSLIALILYIWFRFRDVKYGIAAAIAVFHDVIVALGVVVLVNMTGIVHVPISLAIIAGFLTIIGYSLNDTIVLFDRVRENKGNVKGTYDEVINLSINQTLARTLLTSITTFLVVLVLFALNYGQESPIEGIAFTLMIGVIVGTYSSIFVASPLVIAITKRAEAKRAASR